MLDENKLERGEATLPELLRTHARERGQQVALREKVHGIWQGTTWSQYYASAREVALGLMKLGLVHGDRIIIAAEDVPQWFFADLGAQMLGHTMFNSVLKRVSPAVVSLIVFFEVPVSAIFAYLWLGQEPAFGVFPGIVLILIGCALVVLRTRPTQADILP